ncbi:MAG TPA: ester cyclase [Candidatus Angelobacter sp.]
MPKQENIDVLLRALAKFNVGDIEGYLEMYDKAVIFHGYGRHLMPGIAGLREYYARLRQGFPDMRIDQEEMIAEDNKIFRRFTFYGTHKGDYWGVPPSQKFVATAGQMVLHFKSGKCVEVWQLTDGVTFLTLIGAIPPFVPKR